MLINKKGKDEEMDKPSIFFSHSSKDKDLIMTIKSKIDTATGGVLDVFMSSDGQSIPFGTNWVHMIEDGLKAARIMFVFITNNSISSGWIYFEAGFAYSKGIHVIPVGIDVDVGSLKAPLNLLQGFNISSEDSLNNIIAIINKEFNCHLQYPFFRDDYLNILKFFPSNATNSTLFEEMVKKIECSFHGEIATSLGIKEERNIEKLYESILEFFKENNINYSKSENYNHAGDTCVVTHGVRIVYRPQKVKDSGSSIYYNDCAKLLFFVSPNNFIVSFNLFKRILQLVDPNEKHYVRLHLKEKYSFTYNVENASSIIFNQPGFEIDEKDVNGYVCNELGLRFYVFEETTGEINRRKAEIIASVIFDNDEIQPESIIELINRLFDMGFVFSNQE